MGVFKKPRHAILSQDAIQPRQSGSKFNFKPESAQQCPSDLSQLPHLSSSDYDQKAPVLERLKGEVCTSACVGTEEDKKLFSFEQTT